MKGTELQMIEEIERLLELGRTDLQAGYPQYARVYLQKVLELDADNETAKQAIAEIDALLEHGRASFESVKPEVKSVQPEVTPAKPTRSDRSIIGWIRKEREERAHIVAERKRPAAEKREVLEDEEMGETDLSEGEYSQPLPTDLTELLQFQCQQLANIEVQLKMQRGILDKHTKHLRSINNVASFVLLLIVIGLVLSMCSGFLGTY